MAGRPTKLTPEAHALKLPYVDRVLSGKQPACDLLRLACERHKRDMADGHKRGLYFDDKAAKRALTFFTVLHHSKGEWAGQAIKLEAWEVFIVASLFGWMRADGTRRFRRAYIEVPRKNGKSTLLAGIGLYLLIADNEPGAEVYTAATKRDQARIVHGEAVRMVRSSPLLLKEIQIYKDNLSILASNSKYEPLGADADTMDGLNIHGAVIDELHAHKTGNVLDAIATATGARRQPLIVSITTAGWDRESVCWRNHEYARQVLQDTLPEPDDSLFAFIATIDKGDDWTDPKTWAKANPNYGISVKPDDLAQKCKRAKSIPAEQNSFMRLHLNIWTEQTERWLDLDIWSECGDSVDLSRLAGRACYAGLDLASTTDIAALVLVFPDDSEPTVFDVLPFFWVPESTLVERDRGGNVPFLAWAREGWLEATEGNVIDYAAIMQKFDELAQAYTIQEVAYDRWGATQLIQQMQDAGLTVAPFGQGYASMSPPTKELMTMTLTHRLRHGNHPVLRWMASNMVVAQDPAGNIKPARDKSSEKIDGMVALIMALDRATRSSAVYETRGLLVI